MFNKCLFTGLVASDPELKVTGTGKNVCNFRLQTDKDYHTIVAWEELADAASKLRKGDVVYVEAKARHRSYENSDGKKVWVTEFVATDILLPTRPSSIDDDLPATF